MLADMDMQLSGQLEASYKGLVFQRTPELELGHK